MSALRPNIGHSNGVCFIPQADSSKCKLERLKIGGGRPDLIDRVKTGLHHACRSSARISIGDNVTPDCVNDFHHINVRTSGLYLTPCRRA